MSYPLQHIAEMELPERAEYYKNKKLSDLTVYELALIHLNDFPKHTATKDFIVSTNIAGLVETGSASLCRYRTQIYAPLATCFIVFDQLGELYTRTDQQCAYGNKIEQALFSFAGLKEEEDIKALSTLRHGLMHFGSFTHIHKNNGTAVFFGVDPEGTELLKHPSAPWNGDYKNSMADHVTIIGSKAMLDITRAAVVTCRELLLKGHVEMSIKDPKTFFLQVSI